MFIAVSDETVPIVIIRQNLRIANHNKQADRTSNSDVKTLKNNLSSHKMSLRIKCKFIFLRLFRFIFHTLVRIRRAKDIIVKCYSQALNNAVIEVLAHDHSIFVAIKRRRNPLKHFPDFRNTIILPVLLVLAPSVATCSGH